MQKTVRLATFWAWLPAFRAVAESESLAQASRALRLTPSALSRTIRLLEDGVGQPLFLREGRSLRLLPAGSALLEAVRHAMRRVDDGLAGMSAGAWVGTMTVAAPVWFAGSFIIPSLTATLAAHPAMSPVILGDQAASPAKALLRGEIDLWITLDHSVPRAVQARALPALELATFVGPRGAPNGSGVGGVLGIDDGERLARAKATTTIELAAALCANTTLEVVMPTAIAGDLKQIGPAPRAALALWAVTRRDPGAISDVIDGIEQQMRRPHLT